MGSFLFKAPCRDGHGECACDMDDQQGKRRGKKRTEACVPLNWKGSVIKSLGEDVRVPHSTVRPVRMVGMPRRKRMVAHEIADAPFLLRSGTAQDVLSREFVDRVFHDLIEHCANRRIRGEAMSRGGSFHQADHGLEPCMGWRKRREVELSGTGRTRAAPGTRTRRPSNFEPIRVPTVV